MKDFIDKFSLTEMAVIVICGIALVLSILNNNNELSMAISGGLVGYLGGVTTNTVKKEEDENK